MVAEGSRATSYRAIGIGIAKLVQRVEMVFKLLE